MKIDFGLALDFWSVKKPLSQLLDDYAQLLKLAEDYGFNSVWAGENRPIKSQPGHTPSPLLVLAALADHTNLRLGTGVTLLTLWHPLRLAYDGAMLDQLSDGRFTLGVGVGIAAAMKRYGVPPAEASSRMEDSLRLLKAMWSGADHYHGKHFHIDGGVLPGPVQPGGPPIWVGGTIERAVRRATELGDAWYGATQYHFALVKRQAQSYKQQLEARGTDPSDATVTVNRTTGQPSLHPRMIKRDARERHTSQKYSTSTQHSARLRMPLVNRWIRIPICLSTLATMSILWAVRRAASIAWSVTWMQELRS